MTNYLNPSSAFITLIVGFGLFTGGMTFMGSAFGQHNVQQESSLEVQKEYDKISNKVRSVDNKASEVTDDQGTILDTASAGLLIVPDILGLLVAPLEVVGATIGTLQAAFPTLIPGWFATMLELVIIGAIGFGIFRVILGISDI